VLRLVSRFRCDPRCVTSRVPAGQVSPPRNAAYSTGDVTSAFGITWGQLRYAVERRLIRASPGRDANGHRVWSQADVEAVAAHFGKAAEE
jgi:hypothetical protein